MVHDEIKAAARRRMAQTGEPYCLARCKAIQVGPPRAAARRECGCLGGSLRRRLNDDLVAALIELRKRQARESEDAGTTYGAWQASGPLLTPEKMALTCSYMARSEGLEPPTF
jgi:hypothetical protein